MSINFKHYDSGKLIVLIFVSFIVFTLISNELGKIIAPLIPVYLIPTLESIKEHINVLSPTFLVGALLAWINTSLWKMPFMNWLIDLPNLNGRYKGTAESSFKDAQGVSTLLDCVYEIKQNASTISINAFFRVKGTNTDSSSGEMRSGEIIKQANGSYKIYFVYENNANFLDTKSESHQGVSVLVYFPDTKALQGEYFNSRPNKGNIKVNFIQEKLLYRFD